jgi:glycosyltransferase involved in cell wall biosynthesis
MKISVIIPCYNCAEFIERAVSSVLQQTLKEYEIILVDNNSTDNTFSKLIDLKKSNPQIITVLSEPTKGAPAARNKGLVEAKGEYIQFLDADDELKPLKLESQYSMAELVGADVVIGNHVLIYSINNKIKTHTKYADPKPWEGLITSNLGITSSNLWRKETLIKVNGWDTLKTSSQEYDLLFRLLKNGAHFAYETSLQTNIYKAESSISKSTNKKRLEEIITNRIDLRKNIKAYLEKSDLLTPKLNRMIDTYIYMELMTRFDDIPEFANDYLKNNLLDISKSKVFKTQLKRYLKPLKSLSN